jgi:hypothetical protein
MALIGGKPNYLGENPAPVPYHSSCGSAESAISIKPPELSHSATQPSIQWEPRAGSQEVRRSEREAHHSLPTKAEVKKTWVFTSTPPYAFME